LREQGAEWVFVRLLVMLQLPIFERSQRQGQSGRFGEDVLVVAKQPRPSQHVDQLFVLIVVYGRSVGHGSEAKAASFGCENAQCESR
jgi:hypothetical protein